MKQKVAVIASMGTPPYLGGIENVINVLLSSSLNDVYDFEIYDTYRTPNKNRKITEKMLFACKLFLLCGKFLMTKRPDLVHIHFCSNVDFQKHAICLFVARALGFKTIFHLHGGNFEKMYKGYSFIAQKGVEFIFRIPHRVIALSHYWETFLSTIMNPERLKIINNPIDCEKLDPPRNKAKSEMHKILLLGRVGKHKGHYDALKALPIVLKKYSNVSLLFAGNDDAPGETEHLRRLAQENGIATHVKFLGPVTGNAKINLLHDSSMMILPSFAENMPLSIIEGMAAKIPVVASSVGAIPELFENGKLGVLIEFGNHVALANAIIRLLDNPEKTQFMSLYAYKKVRDLYDIKRIAMQIDKLYQGVMAE